MFGVLKLGKLGASMKKAGLNPRTLFSASEPGAWYDPSDMSTLFQDSAGTVPVTAVEQPVGLMLDKSGWGNHATQTTSTSRPVLKQDAGGQYYLKFDGVDDGMVTNSIDFTATDKMTVFAGVRKLSDSAVGIFLELSANLNTNAGSFLITIPDGANTKFAAALSNGDSKTYNSADYTDSAAPLTTVNTVLFDKALTSAEVTAIRKNGADQSLTRAQNGDTTGNFGNYPLFIGSRAGTLIPFNGHLYGLIVRGAQSTLSQIEATELYMKKKVGIA